MSSSQPISLPQNDYPMAMGSYNSNNGSFNPASYTARFLGSPISWRSSSFGGRHYAGSPMKDMISRSLEHRASTLEPQVQDAYKVFEIQDQMCRNFTCCGVHLNDLHALLEHFEQVHIVVVDNPNANGTTQTRLQVPFEPIAHPVPAEQQTYTQQQQQHQQHQQQQPTHYPTPVDPDDMELEGPQPASSPPSSQSSGAPSPPETLIQTPISAFTPNPSSSSLADAYPGGFPYSEKPKSNPGPYSTHPSSPYTSQPPSPHATHQQAVSAFDTTVIRRSSSSTNSYPSTTNPNSQAPQRPNLNLNLSQFPPSSRQSAPHTPQSAGDPFNTYGRYVSDYSVNMPGAGVVGIENAFNNMEVGVGVGGHVNMELDMETIDALAKQIQESPKTNCVTPAMLFSNAGTPESTPAHSRVGSPVANTPAANTSPPRSNKMQDGPSTSSGSTNPGASTTKSKNQHRTGSVGRPSTTSSLLMSKPFKCPKPNCNKSYKQANGLKYHITHGSCNFAPPKDLEHMQALLDRKRKEKAAEELADSEPSTPSRLSPTSSSAPQSALHSPAGHVSSLPTSPSLSNPPYSQPTSPHPLSQSSSNSLLLSDLSLLPESDLRELERETERRIRPFACTVGDCPRRYKNMNGLRYHYQHSGEHGAVGLAMLASGVHECLQMQQPGRVERRVKKSESRGVSRAGTPPTSTAILQQAHQQQQQQQQQQFQQQAPPQMTYAHAQQAHLAYQQQFAEHQRAQYAAQMSLGST